MAVYEVGGIRRHLSVRTARVEDTMARMVIRYHDDPVLGPCYSGWNFDV